MRALLSVSDKSGLAELGRGLAELGVELIATGGTARTLRDAGLSITAVEDLTGFPELLGGRVKTLHPAVHAGILAPRDDASLAEIAAHNIRPIDLVVCNLYPFEETVTRPDVTLEQAIEQIDIGGVTLLRAAAKNFAHVTTLVDPADYDRVLAELRSTGSTSPETRAELALKAFRHTAAYDAAITTYLQHATTVQVEQFPETMPLVLRKVQDMRYGENPHQAGALYKLAGVQGLADAEQLHGKGLSFTNMLDIDTAWSTAYEFSPPTVVIIKHATPCGAASAPTQVEAYRAALASDPVSAFGGIVGANQPIERETAEAISEIFTEAVVAPDFSDEALEILTRKKNIRLMRIPFSPPQTLDVRLLHGGAVAQELDRVDVEGSFEEVTERSPTEEEWEGLVFAWRICKAVKSNAIVFARGTATVGIGAGQPSRVDSVKLAAWKAGEKARGAVMASDAFFPFPDGIEEAAAAGITAVIQPGGSIRDEQVIAAANAHNMAMVFTGMRHFRH
ncbi:MAG: bifunctional phosphoribosylaminoimidazolecarboxamide formyltransferase/IMP cyclohydrolase PurH [Chloroflexi bacterium]|nr:MAG: bifunctional phosphoribosylaminoimidazolecarboxamide formyltransferase/IMP cyclohydrolase PurH [Chloroflexota bacterium]